MLYSVKEGSVTAVITNWSRQLLLGTRVLLLSCLVKCTGSDSSLSDKYSSFRLCRLFSSTFTVTYRNEKKKTLMFMSCSIVLSLGVTIRPPLC